MKHNYAFRRTVSVLILFFASTLTWAYHFEVDGIYYNITGDASVAVTYGNTEYSGDIVIPSTVTYDGKTYNVTGIGWEAFDGCSGLTSLTIPESVTSIGNGAFKGCSSLTSVAIPSSVTSIGISAFEGCSGLTSVHISDLSAWCKISIYGISTNPLYYAHHLYLNGEEIKDLVIPSSMKSIGLYAFCGCSGLTSLTIPESVTEIGSYAFYGCSGLTSLTIPESVTEIGIYAFYDCRNIGSVTIGTGVKSIGSSAFNFSPAKVIWLTYTPPSGYRYASGRFNYVVNEQFTGLSNTTVYPYLSSMFEVDGVRYVPVNPSERTCDAIDGVYNKSAENTRIGNTVTYMGLNMTVQKVSPYLCYNNSYIKSLEIDNAGDIGEYTFYGCTGLETAKINNAGDIGESAFYGCTGLKTAKIDNAGSIGESAIKGLEIDNAGDIGESAFYGCTGLEIAKINNAGDIGESAFYGCTGLDSVNIDNAGSIGEYAFYGCKGLKTATLGEQVTSLGNYVFSGCGSLTNLEFGSAVRSIGNEAFSGCTAMTKLVSHADTPPACGTKALYDINKWTCALSVPHGCTGAYQQADQWKGFLFINDDVDAVSTPFAGNSLREEARYRLDGKQLSQPQRGLNIIRMNNGTAKKVMVR